jgi:hypothetical protein
VKLYHGSDKIVDKPIIMEANRPLDFGYGFYLTTSYEQARKLALRVSIRNKTNNSYVNSYDFNLEEASKSLKIIKFDGPTKEWLLFVCNNRQLIDNNLEYDVVIGPVADDNVYSVITRYENGIYDLDETLKRLKVEVLKNQILFHTNKSLKYLSFEGVDEAYE